MVTLPYFNVFLDIKAQDILLTSSNVKETIFNYKNKIQHHCITFKIKYFKTVHAHIPGVIAVSYITDHV